MAGRRASRSGPRPSRWDRPKPPKDWRYWVGGTGRVLITIGLLMFGFVAYQLWGTGIQTARAQQRLDREFREAVAARQLDVGEPVTGTPPGSTAATTPGSTAAATPGSTVATTPDPAPATLPNLGVLGRGLNPGTLPASGEPVGRLQIERLDLDWTIVQGVGRNDLKSGPGHFMESPMPGELGNAAVAGHRSTFGEPFSDLDQLVPGDLIDVTNLDGETFHYRVTEQLIVQPTDYDLLVPAVDPTKATLTLITCHPRLSTAKRLAVRAELVLETSPAPRPPTATLPPTIEPELPTEDTVNNAAEPSTADTVAAGAGMATDDGTPTAAQAAAQSEDFLTAGWFSDPQAWPHVAGWGVALIALVMLCYLLARRVRRLWVGVLVGLAPFVVLLYFWFQNVNRLLPPNL